MSQVISDLSRPTEFSFYGDGFLNSTCFEVTAPLSKRSHQKEFVGFLDSAGMGTQWDTTSVSSLCLQSCDTA
jgi:hypothetical protein